MNLHEYQAKEILAARGVPVPRGRTASTPAEAEAAFEKLGVAEAAVKAQVHAGGRGKAGGIQLVRSAAEAREAAARMLGKKLVTHQTGPAGKPVHKVLVEEGMKPAREFYVGLTLDRGRGLPSILVSRTGGMEIEEIARTQPDSLLRDWIDPAAGLRPYQARRLAFFLNLPDAHYPTAMKVLTEMVRAAIEMDATLAEINPLAITADGRLMALDAKFDLDGRAVGSRPELASLRDESQEDPIEREARKVGVSYVSMPGNIGCMVNGAGLAMATMDILRHHGGMPANFLDVGGGASREQVLQAFRLLAANPNVRCAFINIFGGILQCDLVAQAVVDAYKELRLALPMVVRLEGTNVEAGREILKNSGVAIHPAKDMADGARQAVEIVGRWTG